MDWIKIDPEDPSTLPELGKIVLWWNHCFFKEPTQIRMGCLNYGSYTKDKIVMFTEPKSTIFLLRDLKYWMPLPDAPKEEDYPIIRTCVFKTKEEMKEFFPDKPDDSKELFMNYDLKEEA